MKLVGPVIVRTMNAEVAQLTNLKNVLESA
jgi:hypothetical protein